MTIDTPENVRALTFLTDCWREFGVDRILRFRSSLNTGGFSTEWPFISGQESIALDGQWRIEQLAKYAPQLEYGTAPLPPPRGGKQDGCFGGVNRLIIPKGAENAAGAWAFIKFWSGIENSEPRGRILRGWGMASHHDCDRGRTPVYQQYLAKFHAVSDLPPTVCCRKIWSVPPPVPYQQLAYPMSFCTRKNLLKEGCKLLNPRPCRGPGKNRPGSETPATAWTMRIANGHSPAQRLNSVQRLGSYSMLCLLAIPYLLPLLWMVSTSLKGDGQIFPSESSNLSPVALSNVIPNPVVWRNYADAMHAVPLLIYLRNTLFLCAINVIGSVFSSAVVAYGFARLRFRGRDTLLIVLLATMAIPGHVTMIPTFVLFQKLGWYDTFLPLTVPSFFGSALFIFLFRQFFLTLPEEFSEGSSGSSGSERMEHLLASDSSSLEIRHGHLRALFAFLGTWGDFMGPLLYMNDPNKYTLAYGLQQFSSAQDGKWAQLMAASTVFTLPVIILFFFAQRTFIQGISTTGGKA